MSDHAPIKLPKHLYKYRSIGGFAEDLQRIRDILVERKVYWPSPAEFNDPFDCAPAFTFPTGKRLIDLMDKLYRRQNPDAPRYERRRLRRKMTERNNAKFQKLFVTQVGQLVEDSSVYSLATSAQNILMWSHYGNSHKGVCLRFDAKTLAKEFILIAPVRYSEERPEVYVGEEEAILLLEKMLLTKSSQWAYEEEWRILGYKQPRGLRVLPSGAVNGLVLGWRMDQAERETIMSFIEEIKEPIAIYEAHRDERLFAINLVPVNSVAEQEMTAS